MYVIIPYQNSLIFSASHCHRHSFGSSMMYTDQLNGIAHIAYRIVKRSTLIIHIIYSLALSICILVLIFRLSRLFWLWNAFHMFVISVAFFVFASRNTEVNRDCTEQRKRQSERKRKKTITHENSSTLTKLIDSLKPVRIESSFLCVSIFSIFGNSCCCCC